MSNDPDLFSYRYPVIPAAQDTDTSQAAAYSMISSAPTLRAKCLEALETADFTADEIAARVNVSILAIRPRLTELKVMKVVVDSGKRRRNVSGKSAIVWTLKTA